jgi:hypothetical protein
MEPAGWVCEWRGAGFAIVLPEEPFMELPAQTTVRLRLSGRWECFVAHLMDGDLLVAWEHWRATAPGTGRA